jgi:hypothetical protein
MKTNATIMAGVNIVAIRKDFFLTMSLYSFFIIVQVFISASGGQGGRFLKKLPPLDPPAKTFD